MKIHVKFDQEGMKIDQDFEGANADACVGGLKAEVIKQLPMALRAFAGAMSNLAFAKEVVRRANEANKTSEPAPNSCEEFIEKGVRIGTITILEP